MLRDENEMREAAKPSLLMLGAFPAVLFVLSAWKFITFPPTMDSFKVLWMVQELPWWSYLTDPLSAGYAFLFHFEPLWPFLHAIDLLFLPIVGGVAHHLSNVLGVLFAGFVLMQLVVDVDRKLAAPLLALSLFLFATPTWFAVAFAPMNHFQVAAGFALLSLRPAWRAYLGTFRPTPASALASALFFALGLAAKEAVAGVPLLISGLLLAAGQTPRRAVVYVVPHAVVLLLSLLWRAHILGGLGGYPMEASLQPWNLVTAAPMLAKLLWGNAWVGVPIVLALCIRAPRLIPIAFLGYLASLLPFVFAGPIEHPHYAPFSAARLLLTWGWLIAIGTLAVSRLPSELERRIATAVVVVMLALQWNQREQINEGIAKVLPAEDITIPDDQPIVLISDVSLRHAMAYLLRSEPRHGMDAYQTLPSLQLDLALGYSLPENAKRFRIPPDVEIPEVPPLEMDGIQMGADARGRFHLRLPESGLGRLYLSWVQENDDTRWVVTLPLQRTNVDFPLNYSIREVRLTEIRLGEHTWPTHVWQSPFFRSPYPPRSP